MKKFAIILVILFGFFNFQNKCLGDDWILVNPEWKGSVKFVSENIGWSGLWRTKDGGLTWQDTYPKEYEPTDPNIPGSPELKIKDVEPVTESLAFFICQQFSNWESRMTALYYTENCGDKWYRKYYSDEVDAGPYYAQIFFLDAHVGWFSIPGYWNCQNYHWGELHRTENAGGTWNFISCSTIPSRALQFVNKQVGWAIAHDENRDGIRELCKTANSGDTWTIVYTSNNSLDLSKSSDPIFVSENCGWLIDHNNQIRKSIDGGMNWVVVNKSGIGTISFNGIYPFDENKVWIGADNGIFYSNNSGSTWTKSSDRDTRGIYFLAEDIGWATGPDGLFKIILIKLKSCNGGDFLEGGTTSEILWESNGSKIDHISLFYSTDGGITYPNLIEASAPNNGSYSWNIPNILSEKTKIKIQALNSKNQILAEDESNENFYIGKTTKTSFTFKEDNYKFSNSQLYNHIFEPLVIALKGSDLLDKFGSILSILSKITSVGGNCLGMSISSTVYFVDPLKIPVPGKTTNQLLVEEAESNIIAYQNAYAIDCLVPSLKSLLGFSINYEDGSNLLIKNFNKNYPVQISFTESGNVGGHVVVSYKIVDFNIEKRVYIYDVNLPEKENIYLQLTKLLDGSYYFEGYRAGKYFFDRFEPFEPIVSPVDPSEFWFLLWEWIKLTIGGLFQQSKNVFTLNCPANAIITDNYDRRIGILNNQQINEIPLANIIFSDSIEIYELPNDLEYTATIIGTAQGKADIDLLITSNVQTNKIRSIAFHKVPLNFNSKAHFGFSYLHADDSIKIDLDNDGNYEQTMMAAIDTFFSINKPNAPSNLVAKLKYDNEIQLDWIDNSDDEYSFILVRKTGNETDFKFLANLSANTLHYMDVTEKRDSVYYYKIKAITPASESNYSNEAIVYLKTEVNAHIIGFPSVFKLSQNYPNPFNSITKINYQLPLPSHVIIKIYNAQGQEILKLLDECKNIGHYSASWNGKDELNREVTSGIYFYKIEFIGQKNNQFVDIKKMVFLK